MAGNGRSPEGSAYILTLKRQRSHPNYAIDRASASFVTRRLNAWDWGPVSNSGNWRLATRIKSSVQQLAKIGIGPLRVAMTPTPVCTLSCGDDEIVTAW
uniref:Uncharacterized protein n=1 Tax=Oryza sativa subsp. japonica TaxID=39947 RepID=Q6EPF9_ORYSJ|nr:hypothetical protein [Oryza sativa Japonica Group]